MLPSYTADVLCSQLQCTMHGGQPAHSIARRTQKGKDISALYYSIKWLIKIKLTIEINTCTNISVITTTTNNRNRCREKH